MPKPKQDKYIGWPQNGRLDHAMMIVCRALDEDAYMVGSATKGTEYRDVDIRVIMDDAKFNALFGDWSATTWQPFWSLFNVAVSDYLAKQTGLPIDFQVQRRGDVSEADWNEPRTTVGHFPTIMNVDVEPAWVKLRTGYVSPVKTEDKD